MTAAALWQRFCAAAGLPESTPHEVWAFCGGEAGADELAQLALAGIKTATASSKLPLIPPAIRCPSRAATA